MPKKLQTNDQLASLKEEIDEFSNERDWDKFHTPKNLTMALTVEAAELMEIFQWLDGHREIADLSEKKRQAVEHEVADIIIYLLVFAP